MIPELADAPAPEAVSSRYQLRDVLGAGGMGIVYQALDRLTGKPVALKRLAVPVELLDFMSRSDGDALRLSLAREFEFLASLRHPNIVGVLDFGFDARRQPFLVMELIQNAEPITQAANGLNTAQRVELLIQVLQALAYLHRRGIVHRDLKPSNIMVVGGTVKLLDFGLSERRGQQAPAGGTPAYFAPEVLDGAIVNELSDLYTLGVVAYEMFAGRPPYPIEDWEALVEAIQTQEPDLDALGLPPALARIIGKLLAKRPADRYSSAVNALQALAGAAGVVLEESTAIIASFLQAAQFIGRERELATLRDALRNAETGHGSLWLVGGESGVGKSRLLSELRINALVDGGFVLEGQALPNEQPYHVWREPLRKLVIEMGEGAVSEADAAALQLIVPDMPTLLGHLVERGPSLDPRDTENQIASAAVGLFRRQVRPAVLLLEDLQWAGEESLVLLNRLGQVCADIPLLIIATYRDDEKPQIPATLHTGHLIRLNRLNDHEIGALSVAMLGEAGARTPVRELLAHETEGNAYFLVEVVRALAEQAGQLERIGLVTLPTQVITGGIRQIVRRRLDRIPATDFPLLQLAAVYGKQLDLAVLHQAIPTVDLERWLLICSETAVLRVQDNRWLFVHDKIRETILADTGASDRARLHATVAQAIENVHPEVGEFAAALAYHWQGAGDGARELRYAILAGERAFSLSAYAEARRHFGRAYALIHTEGQPATAQQRAMLGTYLGRVYLVLGEYARAQELLGESLRAATQVSDASEQASEQASALRALGFASVYTGDYPGATAFFRQSLDLDRESGDRVGMGDALRALARIESSQGHYAEARAHLENSLSLGRESGSAWHVARALADLGSVEAAQGNFDSAIAYLEESLSINRTSGDRVGAAHALLNLSQLFVFRRQYEPAVAYLQDSITIAGEIGDQRAAADALNNLGYVEMVQRQFTEARAHFEQCLAIFRQIGFSWGIANTLVNLGHVESALGDLHQASLYYREALQGAQQLGATPMILEIVAGMAGIHARAGEPAQAVELATFAAEHPATNPDVRAIATPLLTEIKASLDPVSFDRADRAGRAISLEQILLRPEFARHINSTE